MATQQGKDVIYVDVDDEITAVIDKVRSSGQKIVALVLPKRAAMFQSVVNMKLLKRTADEAKKQLVLITTESGLMPLAGSVGIHVAKTLQSKPEVPDTPFSHGKDTDDTEETVDMKDESTEGEPKLDTTKPVAEYIAPGAIAAGTAAAAADEEEPIELDNTDSAKKDEEDEKPAGKGKKSKGNKKLRIPNFNRFRLVFFLGGLGLVVLIAGVYWALVLAPKATVSVKTDSTNVPVNINLILDTSASAVQTTTDTIPAVSQQAPKTLTAQVNATGTKNEGATAAGTVTLTAEECGTSPFLPNNPSDVPAGTGVSASGQTFITQQNTAFITSGSKVKNAGNDCYQYPATAATPINAQSAGTAYNVGTSSSPSSFTVAQRSDVTGTGYASGGTDNNVQVVTQTDINNAQAKLGTVDTTAITQQLTSQLQSQGLVAISATLASSTPNTTTSVQVGAQASVVTATETVTYTMLGVKKSDLQTVINSTVNQQIDTSKQSILDNGISAASYKLQNQQGTQTMLSMSATAVAGPNINTSAIQKQIAGMKTGDAKNLIDGYPGVTNVSVHYSPFWVSSIPKNYQKVTVTIEKPSTSNG